VLGTESVLGPLFRNSLRRGGGGDEHYQNRSNVAFLSTIRVTFGLNPGPSTARARYNCTPCTPLNPALTHRNSYPIRVGFGNELNEGLLYLTRIRAIFSESADLGEL
jgi:hypothetical protein